MAKGAPGGGAVRAGEILKPAAYYVFLPFGVLSGAVWGLQFISLFAVLLGISKDASSFADTFQGEGLRLWLICGGIWLGLLVINLGSGLLFARRRFELVSEGVIVHGAFGGRRTINRRNLVKVVTTRSVARMMQGTIDFRYADGSRNGVDGGGFDANALGRLSTWMAKS